jgi:hypothetical protein
VAVTTLQNLLIPQRLDTKVSGSLRSVYAIKELTVDGLVPAVVKAIAAEVVSSPCMANLIGIAHYLCHIEFSGSLISNRSARRLVIYIPRTVVSHCVTFRSSFNHMVCSLHLWTIYPFRHVCL